MQSIEVFCQILWNKLIAYMVYRIIFPNARFLFDLKFDTTFDYFRDYLLDIKGLGLKSVECIRLLGLHHVAFPVSNLSWRISL